MLSRSTIIHLIKALNLDNRGKIDRFALHFGLQGVVSGQWVNNQQNSIMRYLISSPDARGPNGSALAVEIAEHLIQNHCQYGVPSESYPELANSLDRDGYELTEHGVRRKLPAEIPLVAQEDQLISLLKKHKFDIARGHYEQAIAAHSRSEWAAANAQLRSFVEEFFNKACAIVCPTQGGSSHDKKIALAKAGFFISEYNEFLFDGKGFVEGFWKRLHPEGSHPGLSEQCDSTFRLHLVILVVHYFLSRFDEKY
jgi:hypothetical protein